jgi:glyceraldehyde-3-phosphate dehydrogenase/erythrose-4-phosphate dehydrogenase
MRKVLAIWFSTVIAAVLLSILTACGGAPTAPSAIVGDPHSSLVDVPLVQVLDGTLITVAAWYDNEQGFSTQLARTAHILARMAAQW